MSARATFLLPDEFENVKVRLRDSDGKYLAADPNGWAFSADRAKAFVFDYFGDRIEDYLKSIAQVRGLVLRAAPVEPKELLETCDLCHQLVVPFNVFFDGRRFLCSHCRGIR